MQILEEMGFQVALLMGNQVCLDVVAVQIHLQTESFILRKESFILRKESFILRKEYNAILGQKMPRKLQVILSRKKHNC
ncbi:hypothetical protein C3C51_19995 [Salmonella enterica subsp. enterica serovar Teko]|nr:hypothetical protein [Salmonella enterica subsp. enterica serovar Teko]EBH8913984.1 hypothetical protein [Salmonella enterica subsp. enterica serovar Teko]ECE7861592.1 hypothetical protein [Salmonella enterica subsp. enterica serovar Teko]